jgi:hypothetical protein
MAQRTKKAYWDVNRDGHHLYRLWEDKTVIATIEQKFKKTGDGMKIYFVAKVRGAEMEGDELEQLKKNVQSYFEKQGIELG